MTSLMKMKTIFSPSKSGEWRIATEIPKRSRSRPRLAHWNLMAKRLLPQSRRKQLVHHEQGSQRLFREIDSRSQSRSPEEEQSRIPDRRLSKAEWPHHRWHENQTSNQSMIQARLSIKKNLWLHSTRQLQKTSQTQSQSSRRSERQCLSQSSHWLSHFTSRTGRIGSW